MLLSNSVFSGRMVNGTNSGRTGELLRNSNSTKNFYMHTPRREKSAIHFCDKRKDLTNKGKGIPYLEETQIIIGGYPHEGNIITDRRDSQTDSRAVL